MGSVDYSNERWHFAARNGITMTLSTLSEHHKEKENPWYCWDSMPQVIRNDSETELQPIHIL